MDRKLISVALIASALVLVSMVSVGLSYSSVYVTEENTCTIKCTYGYGQTDVTGVAVSGSDLTFTSDGSLQGTTTLNVTYNDTQPGGIVNLNFSISGATALVDSLWAVSLTVDGQTQTGHTEVDGEGNATIYGFSFDLGYGKQKQLTVTSSFDSSAGNGQSLQLTIKAIRGA